MVATLNLLNAVPLTAEWSAWYAGQTILAGIVVGGLAIAGARFATWERMKSL